MKNNSWGQESIKRLDDVLSKLGRKNHSKYKIVKLKYMITLINQGASDGCEDCLNYQSSINKMIDRIRTNNNLKEYRHLYELVKNHLITEHHYIQAWTSLLIILVISTVTVSYLSKWLFDERLNGLYMGIIIGVLLGGLQEYKLMKVGKRL